jgi:serine/threonine protein kinase
MLDVALGLQYLHEQNVVHGDLKVVCKAISSETHIPPDLVYRLISSLRRRGGLVLLILDSLQS